MRWFFILIASVISISVNAQIHITPFMPDDIVEAYPDAARVLESKLNNKFEPSFKMVLTVVGQYAYLRKDGVWVVPISALKP